MRLVLFWLIGYPALLVMFFWIVETIDDSNHPTPPPPTTTTTAEPFCDGRTVVPISPACPPPPAQHAPDGTEGPR